MKKIVLVLTTALLALGCADNEAADNSDCIDGQCAGGQGGQGFDCPDPGTACVGEGSACKGDVDVTCHCGYWVPSGSPACSQPCPSDQPPPAATCVPGYACSQPGWTCEGASGKLECYCGMWSTPAMKSQMTCGSQQPGTGGTGGSGGSGGTGGSTPSTGGSGGYGPPIDTYEVRIVVSAPGADHIWCEDAMTSGGSDGATANFYEPWDTMMDSANVACDVWPNNDHKVFDCSRRVQKGLALQFQCYIETGMAPPGDQLRYTCAVPTQLVYSGEDFQVYLDGQRLDKVNTVDNPAPNPGFYNCKVQK